MLRYSKANLYTKIVAILLFICFSQINAQVQLRLEPGVLLETGSDNLGLLLNIEPKVKSSTRSVIGLRFGIAINPHKFEIDDNSSFFVDDVEDNAIISFVPTFDYYLSENHYRPYVGLGLGYYLFSNFDISDRNGSIDRIEGNVNNQVGLLVRGGLEVANTRFGVVYNYIPKAEIQIPDGPTIGTVDNSYFGIVIGFTIIGRKKISDL
ncbi:hypothetical protein J8281_06190 [Aquimarina sp. U1-2]|uniref:hypothetical protein n=1 Tax=Aquimarina sp. U1-2 TaxID=2823141 RepID=UPI001AECCCDC|nr:hypothetical protein [Aquimarina sp. U1-2]MBP2831774.1 hypothetical protein [Aquimarina sp. U1-2]